MTRWMRTPFATGETGAWVAMDGAVRAMSAAVVAAEAMGRARLELDADGGLAGRRRARLLQEACRRGCTALAVDVKVVGAVPRVPCVMVANHCSWLDTVVLGGLAPMLPVADAAVHGWPLVGPLCRQMGVLFVERGSALSGAKVLRAARRAIAEGVGVFGCPETRGPRQGPLLPFSRGLFGLARLCSVPVVPVTIASDDPVVDAGAGEATWGRILMARRARRVEVRVGAPIFHEDQPLGGFVRRVRDVMRGQLASSSFAPAAAPVVTRIAAL